MTKHQSLGPPYGVRGYPTLKFFGADKRSPLAYQGARDIDTLSKYIDDNAEKERLKLQGGEIAPLTPEDIETILKSGPQAGKKPETPNKKEP